MAVIEPKVISPGVNGLRNDFAVVIWEGLAVGDVGEPVEYISYADRSVQVSGGFAGSNVVIEGSNDGVLFVPVRNPFDAQIVLANADLQTIIDTCRYIRPRVYSGTATALKVSLLMRF